MCVVTKGSGTGGQGKSCREAPTHWRGVGAVARVLSNLMLLRDGFPPVVIHSIERQRYYEVLRAESAGLVPLVLESLDNGVDTGIRFFTELEEAKEEAKQEAKRSRRSSAA